jgi:shikimate kinase/3-dehydroquinate synthase
MNKSIILCGFMGTGKSTAGQIVAEKLGLPFIDMDVELERRARKSIAAIFEQNGEAAFRQLEASLAQELGAAEERRVIAAGGGALLNPDSRLAMEKAGDLICLTCETPALLKRLPKDATRPLLKGGNQHQAIKTLLAARQESYWTIPWQIDTTYLTPEQTADGAIAIARRRELPVLCAGGSYTIDLGCGLLEHCGDILYQYGATPESRVIVVTNPLIGGYYYETVRRSLERRNYQIEQISIPDGEQSKTLATVADIYARLADLGVERGDTLLALGGGVVGDLTGFAAATYLRGVRFVQVPTSLLAMVDASVGGKTGVDLPQGKNLVGAFKQPAAVIIDPNCLKTLPEAELRSGSAEVIKSGLLGDADLFEALAAGTGQPDEWRSPKGMDWIERALRVKIRIVEEDPYEGGQRALLNLGHTPGHALEALSLYTLRHGEAVSIGMLAAARLAAELKIAQPELSEQLEALLKTYGLPAACPPHPAADILAAMQQDKKRRQGKLRWVLPVRPGEAIIHDDVPEALIRKTLIGMGAKEGR